MDVYIESRGYDHELKKKKKWKRKKVKVRWGKKKNEMKYRKKRYIVA